MSKNLEEIIMNLVKYHVTVLKKKIKKKDISLNDLIDLHVEPMMKIQYKITALFLKSEIKAIRKDLEKEYEEKIKLINIRNEGNK